MKTTVGTRGVVIAEDIMGGTKRAYGAVRIPEVDKVVITIITDNYYDALRPDTPVTKRFRTVPGASMHAEHGLSFFVETTSNGKASSFMLDYGLDGQVVKRNMDLLGLDAGRVIAFGLSHGHFDHWSGLTDVLTLNRSKIRKGTPLFIGGEAFERRFSLAPGSTNRLDIGQLSQAEIEGFNLVQITEVKNPTEVMPGGYFTGNIERVTEYEKVNPGLLVKKGDAVAADSFPGEQAMVFNLKAKGLVVLSGCAHSGIVNTIKHAQKITGIEKVYAVVGGFHLINVKPEIIQKTVADLREIKPDIVVPAHCTGFEAITLFSKEMPGQFILNTAGTSYTFSA